MRPRDFLQVEASSRTSGEVYAVALNEYIRELRESLAAAQEVMTRYEATGELPASLVEGFERRLDEIEAAGAATLVPLMRPGSVWSDN